ncbi:MAG: hypothetical protein NC131_11135 [Roseburia sp.]|nr:hypothetical protein [Roseburia sp.]
MDEKKDLPILNVIIYRPKGKTTSFADLNRVVTQLVNRLKFLYADKYNILVTTSDVALNGEDVTQLHIHSDSNIPEILRLLDDRAANSVNPQPVEDPK